MNNKITIVGATFIVQLVVHAVGGYYFAPILLRYFSNVPPITVAMFSSSTLSLGAATFFIARRAKFFPKCEIQKETMTYICAGLVAGWLVALSQAFLEGKQIPLAEEILKTPAPYLYINLAALIFIGPFLEEFLYRGYFFELIRQTSNSKTALLVSTVLFVIPHGLWGGFNAGLIYIALNSVVFTFIYIEGGLIPSIATHAFVNSYLTYLNT